MTPLREDCCSRASIILPFNCIYTMLIQTKYFKSFTHTRQWVYTPIFRKSSVLTPCFQNLGKTLSMAQVIEGSYISRCFSSDDEIGVILHGTPEQKRRRSLGQDSSSEDDFEKEMEDELSATVKSLEDERKIPAISSAAAAQGRVKGRHFT